MKTLRFFGMMLMAVLVSFSMTACGDDDDGDDNGGGFGGSSYQGEWVVYKSNKFPNYPCEIGILKLTSNSWKSTMYYANSEKEVYKYVASGSMTVTGNKVKVSGGDTEFEEATWSVSGNTMTVSFVDEHGNNERETYQRLTSEESKLIAAWEKVAIDESHSYK